MRLTIHHSLSHDRDVDLEVLHGTPLHEIVAAFPSGQIWCGPEPLAPRHPAGTWPLLSGAVLSAQPRQPTVTPTGGFLAAFSGPDAGVVVPLNRTTVIGSAPTIGAVPRGAQADSAGSPHIVAVLRDDAVDPHHVTIAPLPNGSMRMKDRGSVNGSGIWRRRGDALVWAGSRRTATIRTGDVVAIGRSLLEVRQGLAPQPLTVNREARGARGGILAELSRALQRATPLARALELGKGLMVHRRAVPTSTALPDPTRTGGWSGPLAIDGAHAKELARAVILARGRRPPHPRHLDEPWLSWLPPALSGDGPIRIGAVPAPAPAESEAQAWTQLTAGDDGTTSCRNGVTVFAPILRVSADTADALARARAAIVPDPPARSIHWADAASLVARPSEREGCLTVVAGVEADQPLCPWEFTLDPGFPYTLIAGAPGSGKSTLLATLLGALAFAHQPSTLSLVVLCTGAPGVLEPYLNLPHVTHAASLLTPAESLQLVGSLPTSDSPTVIMVDDIDALGPGGRAVTSRLEALAQRAGPGSVHLVIATQRPTAVLTPTLRAGAATGIALRTACGSDSLEVTGIADAAEIPEGNPGMAFVRTSGRIVRVQFALPYSDRAARVRRCDEPLVAPTTLASAVLAGIHPTGSDRAGPPDLARTASSTRQTRQ